MIMWRLREREREKGKGRKRGVYKFAREKKTKDMVCIII